MKDIDKDFVVFIAAIVSIALIALGGYIGLAHESTLKSQVKLACYEAAKTNQNIKCDK